MRTDKIFRDYVNRLNNQDTEIRKLKAAINKINDRSTSIVATGSFGEAPSNSHAALVAVQGNGPIHLSDNEVSHLDFFNGTFNEKVTAAITEAGGVVTLTVGQTGGGDLTARFVDAYGTLADNSTIALTVGASDAAPQLNFIYVLQSDPTALVKDTTDWPHTVDHIKVARIFCPTAAFVAASGGYSFQLWNDFDDDDIFQGHLSHIADRIRAMGALWNSGVAGNGTQGYLTPTNNNTELISTAGVVYQLHRHVVPAFTTVDNDVVLVKNWNGDAYHDITNLYDIVADSGGNAIGATKWFNIYIWGVANLTGSGFEPMIINLPSGFYNTQITAENDVDNHDDSVIPDDFKGTGYLIARITIQRAATWVIGSTKDLRGQTAATIGGGGSRYTDAEVEAYVNSVANAGIATGDSLVFTDVTDGALKQDLVSDLSVAIDGLAHDFLGQVDVQDDAFFIQDNLDNSKKIRFQAGNITAANTRTVNALDETMNFLTAAQITALANIQFPQVYLFRVANGALVGQRFGATMVLIDDDADCRFDANILVPDDWTDSTPNLVIRYHMDDGNAYSVEWGIGSYAVGEAPNFDMIPHPNVANDFPAGSAVLMRELRIALTGVTAGDTIGMRCNSDDVTNSPNVQIYVIYLEAT